MRPRRDGDRGDGLGREGRRGGARDGDARSEGARGGNTAAETWKREALQHDSSAHPSAPHDTEAPDPQTLEELVSSYASRRPGAESGEEIQLLEVEVMAPGRPGIVDVIAQAGERVLHLPIGLRAPGEEARLLPEADDPILGLVEDADGLAVATEVTRDAELSALLLRAVTGVTAEPTLVRQLRLDRGSITLAVDDRLAFTVFTDVTPGRRLGLEVLTALDDVGFNHIPAPVALWRRGGRDLGLVQEFLAGASVGSALALTSVRDLYASGGPPELAGGDFGSEANRLGIMTARLHLALVEAFGRRDGDVLGWAEDLTATVAPLAPHLLDRPDAAELVAALRSVKHPCYAIRTHGDLQLSRVYRTEQGWYVGDLDPGGRPYSRAGIVPDASASETGGFSLFRSPLADLADMFWSMGQVATTAANERDPTGREGLLELAAAWEQRNLDAFLAGYLGVSGITDLVPPDEGTLRVMAFAFELEREARKFAERSRT
jgi:maltokinase